MAAQSIDGAPVLPVDRSDVAESDLHALGDRIRNSARTNAARDLGERLADHVGVEGRSVEESLGVPADQLVVDEGPLGLSSSTGCVSIPSAFGHPEIGRLGAVGRRPADGCVDEDQRASTSRARCSASGWSSVAAVARKGSLLQDGVSTCATPLR
jgi:hypothetical protein